MKAVRAEPQIVTRKGKPISVIISIEEGSPTKPGVNGPIATPASRYPTIGESRSFWVISPSTQAAANAAAIVVISGE